MVNIEFKHKKENNIFSLEMSGHARSENKGLKSVCTACSILCYTYGQNMLLLNKDGKLKRRPVVDINDGSAKIVCRPKDGCEEDVLNIINVVYVGFQLLEATYPGFVKVMPFAG